MTHLPSIFRHCKTDAFLWEANIACDKYHPAHVFVSPRTPLFPLVCVSLFIFMRSPQYKRRGNLILPLSTPGDEHCGLSVAGDGVGYPSFPECFCQSCQFVFTAPCQYLPRLHSSGYTKYPRGELAWKMVHQMFGLLLLCQVGLRCKITHKLRSRCLHDMDLVSRLWFKTKWTQYLLFTSKPHQPSPHRATPAPFQIHTGWEGQGIPRSWHIKSLWLNEALALWSNSIRSHLIFHLEEDKFIEF